MTGTAASRPITAWISASGDRKSPNSTTLACRGSGDARRQAGIVVRPRRRASCGQPVEAAAAGTGRASGAISSTRSPPRSSSEASASSSRLGALALLDRRRARTPAHRGRGVAPQADGLRRLPFGLADEPAVRHRAAGLGGLPPVDARDRIAGDEAAELPETVALADPAPAVHALRHGRGDPLGGDQQRRQAGAERLGRARRLPRDGVGRCRCRSAQDAPPAGRSRRHSTHAIGAGGEIQRHAVAQHRAGQRHHIVDAGRQPPVQQRARAATPASAPARRAGRDPRRRGGAPSRRRRSPAGRRAPATGSRPPPSRPPARGGSAPAPPAVPRRSSPAPAAPPPHRWWPAAWCARRPGRDSRRRPPAGTGRAAPPAADRCPPARSGSASPARGTAAAARCSTPPTATRCSCIACSRADWVRGLARLISSAISNWQNTGPGTKRKLRRPSASSSTSLPMMSAGIRSGVNCTRLVARPSTTPSVSTSRLLPRPGTPTSSTWPPESSVIRV